MSGISIKFETSGFPKLKARLRRMLLTLATVRPEMEVVGQYLRTRTHEHFEREESPDGTKWPALSPRYVNAPKRANYKGGRGGESHPILMRSGLLMSRVTSSAGAFEVAVGTNR